MNERADVIRNRDARRVARARAPEPLEPDGLGFGRTLPGSVDLGSIGADPTWGLQASRICDVVRSIDVATTAICEALVEEMAEQRKITDTQIVDLERKIADASVRSALIELENANLRTEISELRREIMVVDHSLSFDRARRAERGHKPPAKSAAAKSKPNGAKPSDGQQLPGFVTK